MIHTEKKRDEILLLGAAFFLAAFLVFFVFKVNGYFDFTSNYGIREIHATMDGENVMAMIDKDLNTEWKNAPIWTDPVAAPGDNITIDFTGKRPISKVIIMGSEPDVLIFMDESGSVIPTEKTGDGEHRFKEPVETDSLRIEVGEGGKDYRWRISELEIFGPDEEESR